MFKENRQKEQIFDYKKLLPSYPRTPHLLMNEVVERNADDIYHSTEAFLQTINKQNKLNLVLSEKMDGANVGMILFPDGRDGEICVRNREHILRKNYNPDKSKESAAKNQFLPFFNQAHESKKALKELNRLFEQPVGVYGEWLYAKHSTSYDKLPVFFMPFDLWLSQEGLFLDPVKSKEVLENLGFHVPQCVACHEGIKSENIIQLINSALEKQKTEGWKSFYNSSEQAEGIYIKVGNGQQLISRIKCVRPDYQSNLIWKADEIQRQKLFKI